MLSVADLIAQVLNFFILMFVLTRILYRPVLKTLDTRREHLARIAREAGHLLEEANRKNERVEKDLQRLESQARDILDQATKRAEQVAAETRDFARQQASDMVRQAEEDIARKTRQAALSMKDDVVDIAIAVAGTILSREVDAHDQEELVQMAARGLERSRSEEA
ncbi:MAG: F0F1 ATP synthase subunit B [Bacillota bacterium]|nr:F0F1 ATP synthase subunit B [Bacillota bacterium]